MSTFSVRDMARCASVLRRAGEGTSDPAEVAGRVVRYLFEHSAHADGGPGCALVRTFRTRPYGLLSPPLQARVRMELAGEPPADLRCLVLLATAGIEPAWNDVQQSVAHRVFPMSAVESAPMIAGLFRGLGVELSQVARPSPQYLDSLRTRTFSVFHEQQAAGSPRVPGQDFVRTYQVASVLAFGGMIEDDFFATILFSREPISPRAAALFRPLALCVRTAFSHTEDALELLELLHTYEDSAIEQYDELDRALRLAQEQSQLLNTILDQMAEGVVVAGPDGRVVFRNHEAGRLFSGTPSAQDWIQAHDVRLADALTPIRLSDLPLIRALHGDAVDHQELFVGRQGRWLSVNARPLPDAAGKPAGGVVVFRDVTEERRATQAALNAHQAFRHLVEASPDGVGVHRDGVWAYANPALLRLLG